VTAPVVRHTQWAGLDAVTLENGALRVTVVPSLGGHVAELVDLAGDSELLWRNPRLTPRPAPYGAWFDDWWSGGWDEIFPSGDQGRLHGEQLPYMGELWCLPWQVGVGRGVDAAWIDGSVEATVAPARFARRLELRADEPVLRVHYRIRNLDVRPLPFTWGIHPAFAVTPGHRIDHPGREMLVGVSSDPSLGVAGTRYRWPDLPDPGMPGGMRDASRIRPREDAVFGGHWAVNLPEGWLALTDTSTRRGVAVAFDRSVFPHAWLWQVYGGWRGHHHIALEAWTSHPMELGAALEAGQARVLRPGEELATGVAFVVYGGLDTVAHVGGEGEGFAVR
jgi:galactose mutarotase-like enzyme